MQCLLGQPKHPVRKARVPGVGQDVSQLGLTCPDLVPDVLVVDGTLVVACARRGRIRIAKLGNRIGHFAQEAHPALEQRIRVHLRHLAQAVLGHDLADLGLKALHDAPVDLLQVPDSGIGHNIAHQLGADPRQSGRRSATQRTRASTGLRTQIISNNSQMISKDLKSTCNYISSKISKISKTNNVLESATEWQVDHTKRCFTPQSVRAQLGDASEGTVSNQLLRGVDKR